MRQGFATAPGAIMTAVLALAAAAFAPFAVGEGESADGTEGSARAVLVQFLEAFNARDEVGWADTLHFPHVRLASGSVTVFETREAFLARTDLDAFAATEGWRRSQWDTIDVVHSGADKVHFAVRFTRYDAHDQPYETFDSLYVVERIDGRWGVRARSSFAP